MSLRLFFRAAEALHLDRGRHRGRRAASFLFQRAARRNRLLVGWAIGVALYLVLAFRMIAHGSASQIKRQSLHQDEGGVAILIGTIVAAMASAPPS